MSRSMSPLRPGAGRWRRWSEPRAGPSGSAFLTKENDPIESPYLQAPSPGACFVFGEGDAVDGAGVGYRDI